VRYRIEVVSVDAELTAPDDVAKKFVKQCRVLVRDYILITIQEWNRPSSGGVPYVGDVAKVKLFDRLMIIFLLPRPDVNPDEEERANEELMQRVKKFALIKMADTSPTYPLFLTLHAYFYTICLVLRYTLWHLYAFSGTNLLTRCHSASFLFYAVFMFQKSYTGNIFEIG
jgi:hypothetical protein